MKNLFYAILLPLSLNAQSFTYNKETGKAMPQFVGELKLLKGRAHVTSKGETKPIETGTKFFPKDVINTEADASVKILIADDTWLSLGPRSELVFLDFEYKDKTDRRINYELKRGQLSANVRQKIKAGELNFKTRYTSMGVRGTKLVMNYHEKDGKGISEYALMEGKAEVFDNSGKTYQLKSGERIVLIQNGKSGDEKVETMNLSSDDLKNFTSPDAEEENGIRPFMPYYELKVETVSALESGIEDSEKKDSGTNGKGSFQNLKKLNDELKENKKRRK